MVRIRCEVQCMEAVEKRRGKEEGALILPRGTVSPRLHEDSLTWSEEWYNE